MMREAFGGKPLPFPPAMPNVFEPDLSRRVKVMKFKFISTAIALLATTTVLSGVSIAQASDLVTKGGDEFTDVEFGTGWYLRGDITYNINGRSERNSSTVTTSTGFITEQSFDYDDSIGARIGMGYRFNPFFRAELAAEGFLESETSIPFGSTFGGNRITNVIPGTTDPITGVTSASTDVGVDFGAGGTVIAASDPDFAVGQQVAPIDGIRRIDSSYTASSFMLNGYADLGTAYGFTPYVGAGIGLGRINFNETVVSRCLPGTNETCANPTGERGQEAQATTQAETEFWTEAYALYAGLAFDIDDRTTVDVGYSYTAFGDGDEIEYDDGSAAEVEGFDIQQIRVGLRYELW